MNKLIIFLLLFYSLQGSGQQQYATRHMNFVSQQQRVRMAYIYEQSATANSKTIVLLHGKNFPGFYWTKTISELLKRGYNVLAPDQIGFGNSSMPAQYQFSFQQLAANTHKLLDTLNIKDPIILGHSMGGMLAIRYALSYPQHCKQLILEDPIGLEDWKRYIPYATVDELFKKESGQTKEGLKKYMLENYFHNEWKPAYDSLLLQSTTNLGNKDFAWCMALTSDMLFTQPVCYEFNNLKIPVVLIIGDLDKTAPGKDRADKQTAAMLGNYEKLGKEVSQMIPDCKLVVLKNIGHIPHVENFDLFMKTLDDVLIKN